MSAAIFQPLARGADRPACWSAVALGVSIPVSVALDSVLLAAVAAGWLAAGAWRETWQVTRANAVALAALGLYALIVLAAL